VSIPDDELGSISCTVISWKGKTSKQAQELLDEAELSRQERRRADQRDEAVDMLREMLKDGPRLAVEITNERNRRKFSERAFAKAVEELMIIKRRRHPGGPKDPWEWALRTADDIPF
jgi:hypothetical protein